MEIRTRDDGAMTPTSIAQSSYEEDHEHAGERGVDEEGVGLLGRRESRSDSISFDHLLRIPLSLSSTANTAEGRKSRTSIGVIEGISLIVGLQIGSGVFSSPGVVLKECGSVGTSLCVLFGAGMLSFAGASSFAELGSAIPLDGGAAAYLRAAYGESAESAFSIASTFVLKPASSAILSLIGGEYLLRLFYATAFSLAPDSAAHAVPTIFIKLVAVLFVSASSGLQAWSARAGLRTQVILTAFKIFSIVGVFVGGILHLSHGPPASSFDFKDSSDNVASYALAMFTSLWCYDGWDTAAYLTGDLKPGTLPKILHLSMITVISLFLLACVSFYAVVPFDLAAGTSTIGLEFGRKLAGPIGGAVIALIVSISCIGALNSSMITTSRLIVAAGQSGILPSIFAKIHDRGTAVYAILLSSIVTIFFVAVGDFATLAVFYGVAAWIFNLAVVIGLIILRIRQPALHRPYRTFIIVPIIFCSSALFLIVIATFTRPWEALAAIGFILASAIPYAWQYYRGTRSRRRYEATKLEMVELEDEENSP